MQGNFMNYKNYNVPQEEMFLGHFKSSKRIKKSLLEWIVFKPSDRIFINIEILGNQGFLCATCDGIGMMRYDNKKSPTFVDSQWVIDEKIGGEISREIERLVNELRNNESFIQIDEELKTTETEPRGASFAK